ncbi:Phosphatidylinositol 4-kinase LSB6 [Saitoella coloradoensis]
MKPASSGYERLNQVDEIEDDEDDLGYSNRFAGNKTSAVDASTVSVLTHPTAAPDLPSAIQLRTRDRSNTGGIDIKAINARLERWADEIASKFKVKRKGKDTDADKELYYSVFIPPEGLKPLVEEFVTLDHNQPMSKEQFEVILESVRHAIARGIHPRMISQGSSGSYFVRDVNNKTVGIFKPKNEEPYGKMNPKWTKWLHRTLFPCFFGRSCLIPNLSYISEAAASVLDRQLKTYMVPHTEVVWLSSKSFHYKWLDRRAYYRKAKPFPQKVGSFQVFLEGFKDANIFLREHPWPDRVNAPLQTETRKKRSFLSSCRPSGQETILEEQEEDQESRRSSSSPGVDVDPERFEWTEALQQNFREELEKLVILDYMMRNTDRGLDNWMIKVCYHNHEPKVVPSRPEAAQAQSAPSSLLDMEGEGDYHMTSLASSANGGLNSASAGGSRSSSSQVPVPHIHVGAIDNSLAFPWKHPDEWRSYPFGWLFLPVSLIGKPFSQKTRDHFLPLLTSPEWWKDTTKQLRALFSQDTDFQERMFAKQMAVLKGQAWNVVETLKQADQGPLDLTRRVRVLVFDDELEVPVVRSMTAPIHIRLDEQEEMDISAAAASAPPPTLHTALLRPEQSRTTSWGEPSRGSRLDDDADGLSDDISLSGPNKGVEEQKHTAPPMLSRGSLSYHGTPRAVKAGAPGRKRGQSLTSRNIFFEEDEGDLGFAAAHNEQANKTVIVERLETVKSKPPVFTWC